MHSLRRTAIQVLLAALTIPACKPPAEETSRVRSATATSDGVEPLGLFLDTFANTSANTRPDTQNAGKTELDPRVELMVPQCSSAAPQSIYAGNDTIYVTYQDAVGDQLGALGTAAWATRDQVDMNSFDYSKNQKTALQQSLRLGAVLFLEMAKSAGAMELQELKTTLDKQRSCVESDKCSDFVDAVAKEYASRKRAKAEAVKDGILNNPNFGGALLRGDEAAGLKSDFPIFPYLDNSLMRNTPRKAIADALEDISARITSKLGSWDDTSYHDLLAHHPLAVGVALDALLRQVEKSDPERAEIIKGSYCRLASKIYRGYEKTKGVKSTLRTIAIIGGSLALLPFGPLTSTLVGAAMRGSEIYIQYAKYKSDVLACTLVHAKGQEKELANAQGCDRIKGPISAQGLLVIATSFVPSLGTGSNLIRARRGLGFGRRSPGTRAKTPPSAKGASARDKTPPSAKGASARDKEAVNCMLFLTGGKCKRIPLPTAEDKIAKYSKQAQRAIDDANLGKLPKGRAFIDAGQSYRMAAGMAQQAGRKWDDVAKLLKKAKSYLIKGKDYDEALYVMKNVGKAQDDFVDVIKAAAQKSNRNPADVFRSTVNSYASSFNAAVAGKANKDVLCAMSGSIQALARLADAGGAFAAVAADSQAKGEIARAVRAATGTCP